MFELVQTAELSNWRGDPADRASQSFLADVRRFVARDPVAAPVPSATPPSKAVEKGTAPSLGVMPFANRSGLAEDHAFAQALVEDIVAALTRSPDIKVLAASATAFRAVAHAGAGRFPEALAAIDEAYEINAHSRALGLRVALKQVAGQIGAAREAIGDLRRVETAALPDRFTGRHELMTPPTLAAKLNAAFRAAWNDGA